MKLVKVLIALAIVLMGISGANAVRQGVANGELKTAGVGQIDYSLTYDASLNTVTNPTVLNSPLTMKAQIGSGYILVEPTPGTPGATITNANAINSFLNAHSAGGDIAAVGLGVSGANGQDASVKNYQMYGYVTPNYAWAGQYADSITGESISMQTLTYNYATQNLVFHPTTIQLGPLAVPTPYTYADATSGIKTATLNTLNNNLNTGYTAAQINGANAGGTDKSIVTLTTAYQFAQAGGSQTPYPSIGAFGQSVNAAGSILTGVNGGTINELTEGAYGQDPWTGSTTYIAKTGTASIAPAQDSMGFEDKTLTYASVDDPTSAGSPSGSSYHTSYVANFNGAGYESPGSSYASTVPLAPHICSGFPYSITTGTEGGATGQTFF